MGNQIILVTDTIVPVVNKTCLGMVDVQVFQQTTIHLAYICLITGAVIGFISGYYYAKRRYGDL